MLAVSAESQVTMPLGHNLSTSQCDDHIRHTKPNHTACSCMQNQPCLMLYPPTVASACTPLQGNSPSPLSHNKSLGWPNSEKALPGHGWVRVSHKTSTRHVSHSITLHAVVRLFAVACTPQPQAACTKSRFPSLLSKHQLCSRKAGARGRGRGRSSWPKHLHTENDELMM